MRKFLTDPLLESGCTEADRGWYEEITSHEVVLDTGIPVALRGCPYRWGLGVVDRSPRDLEGSREIFGVSTVEGRICFLFFADPPRLEG